MEPSRWWSVHGPRTNASYIVGCSQFDPSSVFDRPNQKQTCFLCACRRRYDCRGWFKITRSCKQQLIGRLCSLGPSTHGCCTDCVRAIGWTEKWSTSAMWRAVQRPVSTIHLQCNGRNGRWVYSRLKRICCQLLWIIRTNSVVRIKNYSAMRFRLLVR